MADGTFAQVEFDPFLNDADERFTDGYSLRCEYPLQDGAMADHARLAVGGERDANA